MIETRWTPSNQQMVAALKEQYPEVRTGNLAAREITATWPELDDVEVGFCPDGVVIDREARRVDVFEVEVTHAIPQSTMWKICDLWVACDAHDIELNLFVVNRYGHIGQVEIGPWYLQLLAHHTSNGAVEGPPETLA
jgi:hypothetical protein